MNYKHSTHDSSCMIHSFFVLLDTISGEILSDPFIRTYISILIVKIIMKEKLKFLPFEDRVVNIQTGNI